MKGYILRRPGLGAKTTPIIAEVAGLTVLNSHEELPPADADVVVRWGTTTSISGSPRVINKSKAIESSSDKRHFRTLLQVEGLCPKTWNKMDDFLSEQYASFDTQSPVQSVLVRPAVHARSEDMFLCTGFSELKNAIQKVGGSYYISEFIQKKKEFRVMVVQNKVSWVIEKHPKSETEVSWGCVEEGSFDYVDWSDWPIDVIRNALRSVKLSGLDFGAADVIVDQNGKAYTLEVNTAPWLSPYYAKQIGMALKWMISGKDTEEKEINSWKDAIHPCRL